MLKQLRKRTEGFTIIEVMIVLAIAGLILLIVFLAVPALQRNSRNTNRRNDAGQFLGALQETINNSNGTAPTGTTVPTALATVASNSANMLTAVNYNVNASSFQALVASGTIATDTVYIRNFSVCADGSNGKVGATGGTARQFTATYLVETPGAATSGVAPAGYTANCTAS